MSTTTMHFGPEWMRSKPQAPVRSQAPPSPPPASNLQSATSTYSALVSAVPASQNDTQDDAHPFRYTKEELLRIYKESPKGGLGLEVERWEGVVREIGSDPVGLREMGEGEKKLFAGPLNSDLRRRQSTDYLSPLNMSTLGGDRPRLNHNSSSGAGSPLRERYPGFKRRDSNADSPTTTLPRKQSISTLQSPGVGARSGPMPSPRVRQGFSGGFDGVLGAGETWTSRRRASEASRPGAITRDTSGGGDVDSAEKLAALGEGQAIDKGTDQSTVGASIQAEGIPVTSGSSSHGQVNAEAAQVSNNVASTIPPGDGPPLSTEPKDLASVEWSYKDPSGAVQGPFRADVMQKWYDDGYFALDLPMKRVQYDSGWVTVKELTQRATSDKIFLSTLRPLAPPGLTKREASPLHSVLQPPTEQNTFPGPYQPAPIRSLRSSTLDSFNGSNPSDSPSSSIGGHFGNNSPDPLAFGGRSGNGNLFMGDNPTGLGFSGGLDLGGLRRTHLQDFAQEPHRLHSPSYSNNVIGNQGYGANGHGYPGQFSAVQSSPWGTQPDPFNSYNSNYALPASPYAAQPPFNSQLPNQIIGNPMNPMPYGSSDPGVSALSNQFNVPNHVAEQHGYPQGYRQYQQPITPAQANTQAVPGGESAEYQIRQDSQFGGSASQGNPSAWDSPSASSWDSPSGAPRRTNVFDAGHPTTLNTSVPTASSQSSPWTQTQPQPITTSQEISPWLLSSQGVVEWGNPAEQEIAAATAVELEKLVEEPEVLESTQSPVDLEATETSEPSPSSLVPEEVTPVEPVPAPAPKGKKNKSVPAPVPAEAPVVTPTATPVSPAQKSPWAKDEKKKGKSSGAAISLREIQDAEAKAAEVRKANQEKERANRLAVSVSTSSDSKEEAQPFTASWGLPTSQAGGRTNSFTKDVAPSGASPVSPAPPVWTNAGKPATIKKTMKEIQEEEERRKKAVAKEAVASAAAKRAQMATPSAPPSTNNAWVTVGPSGKTNPAVAAPPRPTAASVAAASTSARPNGTSALRPATQAPASKPATSPIGGKVEDFPVSPSHEFLKWLSESLKGLNNSVNVEEIISMLLSFSLDPDPVTIEIIQETIYANSTTLDGRRFAAEFVAKRKADAANRRAGNGAGKAAAKVSIADVVKATPKTSQPEWGFKIVNKKKKGTRP